MHFKPLNASLDYFVILFKIFLALSYVLGSFRWRLDVFRRVQICSDAFGRIRTGKFQSFLDSLVSYFFKKDDKRIKNSKHKKKLKEF